jgi:hypothetical protein
MKKILLPIFFILLLLRINAQLKVNVTIPTSDHGRLILILSKDLSKEPRFTLSDDYNTQIGAAIDIAPGQSPATFSFPHKDQYTYPIKSWADLPEGTYNVQAVLNRYEKFNLSTGHSVLLPPEMGEGQQWNSKPKNIYSLPQKIVLSKNKPTTLNIKLDQTIPPIAPPKDTKWIKHISMKSERLSKFWGRDIYLGAHVLLPRDFEKETQLKYPLMIYHGHFPSDFHGFRTEPVPANIDTSDYSERFKIYGYKKIQEEEAYKFYKQWTSDTFPKFLIIEIQHATPYYDDSYAVNSAAQGPYGDAIAYELIPYIESLFRGVGSGKSRFLYGGSTGGWEALAAQVFYPDEYNGCFAACPDPIDFRAYCTVNLYEDKNAYQTEGPNMTIEKPAKRDYLGHISSTVRQANQYELLLGNKSRSGQQWDIWEATYSPIDKEGYPHRIFDKVTGVINKDVANYWKENFDLVHIIKRDWSKIGKKLEGKINLYCGDMDNFYLNNAVYLGEEFLKSTTNPHYNGEVKYGDRAEHCWNGNPNLPNYLTRLHYHTMYLGLIKKRLDEAGVKY